MDNIMDEWNDENEIEIYHPDEHALVLYNLQTILKALAFRPYDPTPSVTEWREVGQAIGTSTSLECLIVNMEELVGAEDIETTDNLEAFVRGIAQNRSIKELEMEQYDFSSARLELIHPFIIENDKLEKLGLSHCGFGQNDFKCWLLHLAKEEILLQ